MSGKSVALIANGMIHNYELLAPRIQAHDEVIAVDGGLHHCHKMGIVPHLIIGDMDSVSPELLSEYSQVKVERFPADKDEIDLELALKRASEGNASRITIYGAMERRTDHALHNLHLLRRYLGKALIETEEELLFIINGEKELSTTPGQTVSLIPLGGDVEGITTKGLKWELDNATLSKDFMSISNVCLGERVRIHLTSGDLLCCLHKVKR